MPVTRSQLAFALLTLLLAGSGIGAAHAETVEELKGRIEALERSTREQVEALKRAIQEQEQRLAEERRRQEEREQVVQMLETELQRQAVVLQAQEDRVGRFLDGWENFFDLQAGRKQGAESERNPLGKDIAGNVYAGDAFKIRLGGSLRLHVQRNDTPVGESVTRALLPDATVPGGGNNADRDNFRAFAGRTRLNLAIQGPPAVGGKTQGFFEADFNRQFTAGEVGAVNNNPRLRHAFARWSFDDLVTEDDELILTLGQTTSFADNVPDTVDFNTMKAFGAALRRNPRVELLHKYPLGPGVKFVSSIGVERPFFDNAALGGDLGGGDLSGFPAVSGGIGLETGRIGAIGSAKMYLRTTWGEFEERLTAAGTVNNAAQTNFSERHFTNQTVWGTFTLDRIGFNPSGRAMTLQLRGGGLWTRGEARHLNAEFDRQVIRDTDGSLKEAESAGGFINPIFWITDTVSVRLAGGVQFALDSDRPVVAGSLISDGIPGASFFRVNNRQFEVSLWWTPGPFTFALSYNHTKTNFRQVSPAGGSESRENENNKIEFISWFSF